jgi:hypothetical protein
MAIFLVGSTLTRGDLQIKLHNDLGYLQDGVNVRWSITTFNGDPVSGSKLPAIKQDTGTYYAPWQSNVKNGNYVIRWEYQDDFCGPVRCAEQNFFIVDPSSYNCTPCRVCDTGFPEKGGFTFLTGSLLGQGDLPLYLKDGAGLPADAFMVFWTVLNAAGKPISPRTIADRASVGEYFASWFANVQSGNYRIKWEWQETADSPQTSSCIDFSVINPALPYAVMILVPCNVITPDCALNPIVVPGVLVACCDEVRVCPTPVAPCPCPSPVFPTIPIPMPSPSNCCDFEIPRVIHLVSQSLPSGGGYTNQPYYLIPPGIRKICFYINYTRGAIGGFATYRIMWGNGTEETQETLVDAAFAGDDQNIAQAMYLQDLEGPIPQSNSSVNFMVEVSVPGGVRTVRLLAAEKGKPGAPGTTSITLTASSG